MIYRTSHKALVYYLIPAYLSGDFALYRILSKKYNIRPSALKVLLYMYMRHTLIDGKKSLVYSDLIDPFVSVPYYSQSVKTLRMSGLVSHVSVRGGYIITDKGLDCIKEYYESMKVYVDLIEERFGKVEISNSIVSESSSFYSK